MTDKIKILFLAANPEDTVSPLRLDKEYKDIAARIRRSPARDLLTLFAEWSLTPDELQETLLENSPHILHFSGHGADDENKGIALEDASGNTVLINKKAFARLLNLLEDNIRIVLLNACYTKSQAALLTDTIDFVIGMNRPIGDEPARIFASHFYQALAYGRSVQKSFDLALTQLDIKDTNQSDIPELLVRKGVDASKVVLIDRVNEAGQLDDVKEIPNPETTTIYGDQINQQNNTKNVNAETVNQMNLNTQGGNVSGPITFSGAHKK